jgi:hypothetical protein
MLNPASIDRIRREAPDGDLWLQQCARNVYSQGGEDGILAAVLHTLPEHDGWCVEFGAWDGRHLSNTFRLIDECGYRGVLIEGDRRRYEALRANFERNDRVVPIHAYVGFDAASGLDRLLATTDIPRNIDVLSIDIDGNDYHAWEAVQEYRPKVVIIEFNPTISNEVEFVQARDGRVHQGSSLLSLTHLARTKGYQLVAATTTNGIFVDAVYFPLFGIADNSAAKLRQDLQYVTHVFCGFDGHVFLRGSRAMPWHRMQYEESRVQMLPAWCQDYPPNYGRLQRLFWKLARRRRAA